MRLPAAGLPAGEPGGVTAVDGNALGLNTGTSRGYACGIWVQLPAVASGSHQLVIKGTSGGFSVEADYSLTVG